MADGMREPLEECCDGCGDMYTPCACDIDQRVWDEHGEMLELLEQLEARLTTGMPLDHYDELRMRARKVLASAYRGQ